jgi:hypothetical protein
MAAKADSPVEPSFCGRTILRAIWLVAAAVAGGTSACAEPLGLRAKEHFHLFLLLGQSNMAGRGTPEMVDREPNPRVLMFTRENCWVAATEPMHFDRSAAGVGPGRSFGVRIAERFPGITVGLVPCAVGASAIESWRPGILHAATKKHPWDDALRRAKLALRDGTLKGILWHQGESDAKGMELARAYEARLHDLIRRLREELHAHDVPFIAGQLGKFPDAPWDDARKLVDTAHQALPRKVPHTAFVSAEGLQHRGDKVHFDSPSYRELGSRYAEAFFRLSSGKLRDHE